MSGSATFVANAEPTITYMFSSTQGYYIAAINEVEQGEVMDKTSITKAAELQFPTGVCNMTATLKADNTWSITPSTVGQGAKDSQVDQVAKDAKVAQA